MNFAELPNSKNAALDAKSKYYFTAEACKNGHITIRFTSNRGCVECLKQNSRNYHQSRLEKNRARCREYAKHNPDGNRRRSNAYYKNLSPDKKRELIRSFYDRNQTKIIARSKAYYEENREEIKVKSREFKKKNRAYFNAINAARYARKLQAMPIWADKKSINEIYRQAKEISVKTGILHHVDHIIPLNSSVVCGLHVPANLQILPAIENIKKGNKIL